MSGLGEIELNKKNKTVLPFIPTEEFLIKQITTSTILELDELYFRIWRGCLPEISVNNEIDHNLFYSSYVQTYIQRDIRELTQVGDEMKFFRFIRAAAARTAQLLNLSELARDADISPNTAKSWLSILKSSNIIYLLEPYFSNITKRLIKAPKLYFIDIGLCVYLTEWTTSNTLEAGAMVHGLIKKTQLFV